MPEIITLPPVPRRTVLAATLVGAAASAVPGSATAETASSRYFAHGVASGDPRPHRVVLWTRVTPTKASRPGSGQGPKVKVTWQVAKDARFSKIISSGRVSTGAYCDHTVKVDAKRLPADTNLYYRFVYKGTSSPVGRTKTAPKRNAENSRLRFGMVSCANLQAGYFSAYRHLAKRDDLDFVLCLGDYLYEYGPGEYGYGFDNVDIRSHTPGREMVSLNDYRQRHAQYKQDPDLMRLHARYPWIVTWDDHEVTNDAWVDGAENHNEGEGNYASRKRRAHRAYDEWMPLKMSGTAALRDGTRLFRRLKFGRLAELSMLDLRSYRSEQAAGPTPDVSDPTRTITGNKQMKWLKESLRQDRAVWKLIGNPVMIAPVAVPLLPEPIASDLNDVTGLLPEDGAAYNVDQWDGYTADRTELFAHLQDFGVQNSVFLTGDIHSSWACDLPVDASTYPATGVSVGVEFVCASITSNNLKDITNTPPRTTSVAVETAITTGNPHVKFLNFDDHGFSVIDVTAQRVHSDYFIIGERADRNTGLTRLASWRTNANSQRVQATTDGIDD